MAADAVFRRIPRLRSGWQHDERLARALRETAFIVAAALLYTLVRGFTGDRVDRAFRHAEQVITFERSTGLDMETDLQGLILEHGWAVDAANAVYIYCYWPVFLLTLLWLIVRRPDAYPKYRNALLASGALTLVVFAFFPLAPPRFMSEHGFVDTITVAAPTYRQLNSPAFVNEYAAMPSLHFGWVLLFAIAWVTLTKHPVTRALGALLPVLMFFAIIMTGNHYVVDAVAGGVIVLAGLGIAELIERRKGRREVHGAVAAARRRSDERGPLPPAEVRPVSSGSGRIRHR